MQDTDDVHWDRDTYREAQAIYATIKRQIATLQSLNATLYRRIRAARRNHQAEQEQHADETPA